MIWQISSISQEHQLSNQCHWCLFFSVLSPFWSINSGYNINSRELANMSNLWKRKIIFNIAFHGTYVTSQEGRIHICRFRSLDITQEVVDSLVQLGKFFGWGDAFNLSQMLSFFRRKKCNWSWSQEQKDYWCRWSGDVGSTLARLAQSLEIFAFFQCWVPRSGVASSRSANQQTSTKPIKKQVSLQITSWHIQTWNLWISKKTTFTMAPTNPNSQSPI